MNILLLLLAYEIGYVIGYKTSRSDKTATLSSLIAVGGKGTWSSPIYCNPGHYAKGYSIDSQNKPSGYDPTEDDWGSVYSFKIECDNGEQLNKGGSGLSSSTTYKKLCNSGKKVYGFKTKADEYEAPNYISQRFEIDKVGLTDVRISCSDKTTKQINTASRAYKATKQYCIDIVFPGFPPQCNPITVDVPDTVWGSFAECPVGSMVCGFRQKMQGNQGNGDDTGVNGVELYCCSSQKAIAVSRSTSCNVNTVAVGEEKLCEITATSNDNEKVETTTLTITNTFDLVGQCQDPRIVYSFKDNAGHRDDFNGDIEIYEGDSTSNSDLIATCLGINSCVTNSCVSSYNLDGNYLASSSVVVTTKIPQRYDSQSCSFNGKKIEYTLGLICKRGVAPIIEALPFPDAFSWSSSGNTCKLYGPQFSSSHAWCALASTQTDPETYLQVDLGQVYYITKVSTKGRANTDQWTTEYNLEYSTDGIVFIEFMNNPLKGNTDRNTAVVHSFVNQGIIAQYLRFIPLTYNSNKAMRIEAYGEALQNADIAGIGSIVIDVNGGITTTNQDDTNLDVKNLYCGNDEDKPLWAGLLSLNEDILSELQSMKGEDGVNDIFKYIECTEFIYYAVSRATVPGPVQLLDVINAILSELQKLETVGDKIGDTVDEISSLIVGILDEITPDITGINWANEWIADGTIFNPFEKLKAIGNMLSKIVCKAMVGNDLQGIIEDLRNSDGITEIKNSFQREIENLLNSGSIINSDTRTELLNNDYYKDFSIVMSVGMQICFSKGMNGCVLRSVGFSSNLRGETKIFESRSMSIEFPSLNVGVGAKGFAYFDFLSKYDDVTNTELALYVGIAVQTPPAPGSDAFSKFMEIWDSHSDKLGLIPFISDAASIGSKVNFINGALEDNVLIIDILTGGANARLSIIYGFGNADLLNCNGFRIDLSVGDSASFGFGVHFGYEYRKNSGIQQGLDWLDDIDTANFKEFGNIISDITTDTVNIFDDALDSIGREIENLGIKIGNAIETELYTLLNKMFDGIEEAANVIVDGINDGPVKLANSAVDGVNNIIDDVNGAVISKINVAIAKVNDALDEFVEVEKDVAEAKSDCKSIGNECWAGVCIDDIVPINTVCNNIFAIIEAPLGILGDIIDEINIPSATQIATIKGSVPTIPPVDIGINLGAKIEENMNNMIDNNLNKKQEPYTFTISIISPMVWLIILIYTVINIIIGYYIKQYLLRKNGGFAMVKNYTDTDTEY